LLLTICALPLASCDPTEDFAYMFLSATDPETGDPVVGASVEYVPVTEEMLSGMSGDEYLDEHGRSAGATDERGEFEIWTRAIFTTRLLERSSFLENQCLIRIVVDGQPETLVLRSNRPPSETGFFSWLGAEATGERVLVRLSGVDNTNGVDAPIPSHERSGWSRRTLEIVATATGQPVSGTQVDFVTVPDETIQDRSPEDYIAEHGFTEGRTNRLGQVEVRVFTTIPAYRSCGFSLVDDQWIVRVDLGDRLETVVLRESRNVGPASLFSVDEGVGESLTITTPFGDCFE
jgi:hypothetical protein